MAYMELTRGFLEGDTIQYPIYDISVPTSANVIVIPVSPVGQAGTYLDSCLGVTFTRNADISAAFPEEMPRTIEQDGCICQNDYHFVSGTPNWLPKTQAFSAIPVGTKPDDWDTHFFDYYTASVQTLVGNRCSTFDSTINGDFNYANPPAWSNTATYYHDDLPVKQRTTHLFKSDAGYTFGVNLAPNYSYRYIRGIAFCNPGTPFQRNYQFSAIHTPEGRAINFGGSPSTDYTSPYQLQSGFFASLPFVQIFVHITHNEVEYWGPAQVLMSDTSASAHPIGLRLFAMPESYWGTSIHGGGPSQGGEWGESTQRAGGQGLHAATSDARGDRAGTTVRDIMSSRDSALALAFDTPFMRTYTFDNLSSSQIAEIFAILYGTDYWSLFQNQMLNPLASIVAFHLIPSTLRGANLTLEDLIIGPKNISAAMTGTPQVTKIRQIKWYHIGTVDMSNVLLPYFDAYPDFAPYTDIILHLPYIGDIKIDVNAVMYGALSVEYACDNVSGNVSAWIYCEDRYPEPLKHKQYKYIATGNCAYSIPLFAQSQSGLDVGKIIGSGVGIVGGAATGNLAAAVSGAMGIGSALYEHSRAPITTQQTGGSSGNVAILGDSDVWIEVIRPQWIQPESYQQLVGIPSGISGTLAEIGASGRVVCSDIETDGIAATEPELREIERLLLSGIYLKPHP